MSQLLIQFSHLFTSFGPVALFEDISLAINQGDVFALIGENGAGKTTLLKLLTGDCAPDSGEIRKAANLTVGLLPQEIIFTSPAIAVRTYMEASLLSELEQEMAACLEDENRLNRWAELQEKYEQLGGYRMIPLEKVVQGLKLDSGLLDLPMSQLSSGQRTRAALAKALLQNPQLLLLDEPTNHLDRDMLEWLENILRAREGATVIVNTS